MVLRRCLAGALAVSGALAAGSYAISPGGAHGSPPSVPVRAASSHLRSGARVTAELDGAAGQVLAAGASLGDLLGPEVTRRHRTGHDHATGRRMTSERNARRANGLGRGTPGGSPRRHTGQHRHHRRH